MQSRDSGFSGFSVSVSVSDSWVWGTGIEGLGSWVCRSDSHQVLALHSASAAAYVSVCLSLWGTPINIHLYAYIPIYVHTCIYAYVDLFLRPCSVALNPKP